MIKHLSKYIKLIGMLLLIIVVTATIRSIISVQVPLMIQSILNKWTEHIPEIMDLFKFGILLFSFVIIRVLANFINISAGRTLEARLSEAMMAAAIKHINRLPLSIHDRESLGGFLSRGISDVENFSAIVYEAPNAILSSVLMIGGSILAMMSINMTITIIVLGIIPLYVAFNIVIGPKVRKSQYGIRKNYSKIMTLVENSFSSIRLIKAFHQYHYMEKRIKEALNGYKTKFSKQGRVIGGYKSGFLFLRESIRILVVCYGGYLLAIGKMSIGDLVAFQLLTMSFLRPIDGLLSILPSILKAYGSFDRYQEIMNISEEKDEISSESMMVLKGDIEFRNLCFSYENASYKEILKGLTLKVKHGEHIGFVGTTGGGKSTILSLLMKFYEVPANSVYIDGRDIHEYSLENIRNHVGIVQQEAIVFEGTIRENLLIARPDATDHQLYEALDNAEALDFVRALDRDMDTFIGHRGVLLSGGQCQRIAIARIFLKDPKILLLDEATSSLDNNTEKSLQQALNKLLMNRTAIIVAHRLSTVEQCDKIYVIEEGKVSESGTHDELLKRNGDYYKLYNCV